VLTTSVVGYTNADDDAVRKSLIRDSRNSSYNTKTRQTTAACDGVCQKQILTDGRPHSRGTSIDQCASTHSHHRAPNSEAPPPPHPENCVPNNATP